MEQLAVGSGSHLVDDGRFEIEKHASRDVLPAPVSEKNVLNASSPPPMVLSAGICPSGLMPCYFISIREAEERREKSISVNV